MSDLTTTHSRRGADSGSALLIAIFALVLLTAMGLGVMSMGQNELALADAGRRSTRSFYLAEAAVEHARMSLFANNGSKEFDTPLLAASGGAMGNGTIDFDPDALVPIYDATGTLTGFSAGVGDDTVVVTLTTLGTGVYGAFLSNDPIDGVQTIDDTNGRVMLTGVGSAADRSFEVVQVILELDNILFSPPPAALTILGPSPGYSPGSSSSKLYDGDDCPAGTPGAFVPSVGLIGTVSRDYVRTNMGAPTYSGGGLAPVTTIADVTDVSEPTVTTAIDARWTDCAAVKNMIERIRSVADVVCFSQACALPPSSPDRVVFVESDYSIGTGEGLIVVTGRATMGGGELFRGTVLVVGQGEINRAGSASVEGAVIVADVAGPDNTYGTADDCQSGFEPADFGTSGGGSSLLGYCSAYNPAVGDLYLVTQFLQR